MKGSLKIWMVILGMVVIGVGITFMTNSYVSRQIEKMAETSEMRKAEAEIVQEDAVVSDQKAEAAAENSQMNIAAAQGAEVTEFAAGSGRAAEVEVPQEELTELAKTTGNDGDTEKREHVEMDAGDAVGDAVSGKSAEEGLQEDDMDELLTETAAAAPAAMQDENLSVAAGSQANSEAEGLSSQEADLRMRSENDAVLNIIEYSSDLQEELHEYQERFPQLDSQIEQMRKSETENNMYSVKNSAQTERRIWERELDGIYRLLCDSLDETAAQELKKEQQEWQQVRDTRAEEAAKKNSGGSLESVDYIASVAASNRERAYALLEKYMEE